MHILIAMPIYRQTLYIQTLSSLMELKDHFWERGIRSSFVYVDSFDIVSARNMISTYFYNTGEFTHLFFVDDDMAFSHEDIIDLLLIDQPFSACICPKRQFDAETLYKSALKGQDLQAALATSLDFVVAHRTAESLVVERNFCKVKSIGMAVTMLRRDVFVRMITGGCVEELALDEKRKVDAFGNSFHYGFFSRIYSKEFKGYLGEDYSFCQRWTESCQGEIYGLVTAKIGHVGTQVFEGRYIDSLKAGKL